MFQSSFNNNTVLSSKEDSRVQEKYLENKIKEGTEKLKTTLKKIKDDMEKYSVRPGVDDSALSSFHHHAPGGRAYNNNGKLKSKFNDRSGNDLNQNSEHNEDRSGVREKINVYSNILSPQSTEKLLNVNSTENLNNNYSSGNYNNKVQNLLMSSHNSLSRSGNNNEDSDNEYVGMDKKFINQRSEDNLHDNTNNHFSNLSKSGTFKTDLNDNTNNHFGSGSNFFDKKLGKYDNDTDNENTKNNYDNSNDNNKYSTYKEEANHVRMSSDFNNENEDKLNYINNNNTFSQKK